MVRFAHRLWNSTSQPIPDKGRKAPEIGLATVIFERVDADMQVLGRHAFTFLSFCHLPFFILFHSDFFFHPQDAWEKDDAPNLESLPMRLICVGYERSGSNRCGTVHEVHQQSQAWQR